MKINIKKTLIDNNIFYVSITTTEITEAEARRLWLSGENARLKAKSNTEQLREVKIQIS